MKKKTDDQASNSQAEIGARRAVVTRALESATSSSWEGLHAHKSAGAGLIQLKEVVPHGQFRREVETRVQISKQWAAKLMQLHRCWPQIEDAFAWAQSSGQSLSRTEFSVDGALALLRKWERRNDADAEPPPLSRGQARARQTSRDEIEDLKRQLREALAQLDAARERIRALEAEIYRPKSIPGRLPIDDKTKSRAENLAALWQRPGTEDEGRNAEQRLREMAERFGRTLTEFLDECGLEGRVKETFDDAQARAA
jgi:hypothetical protein